MTLTYRDKTLKDIEPLLKEGFVSATPRSEHEWYRLTGRGATIILYRSGRLVVQGNDELDYLFHTASARDDLNNRPVFGSDETLKGDTFGGLIVVGFSYYPGDEEALRTLGVRDSKLLSEKRISEIAGELRTRYADRIHDITLTPEEYNATDGVTGLLNRMHKRLGTHASSDQLHVVDAYPGCRAGDLQLQRAESESLAVAAASIVARDLANKQFEALSKEAGFRLPKGSTHVQEALHRLIDERQDLRRFAKLSFRNVQAVIRQKSL